MRSSKERLIHVRIFRSHAEADAADREFWERIDPVERVADTWRLSEELWRLKGQFNDEPGLCRSVARVRRG